MILLVTRPEGLSRGVCQMAASSLAGWAVPAGHSSSQRLLDLAEMLPAAA
jgi:hypothetical protein